MLRVTTLDPTQPTDGSPDANITTAPVEEQTTPKRDGVQHRIDELTAQLRDSQRQAAEAQAAAQQAMQLAAQNFAQSARPPPPAPPQLTVDIPEGMDPAAASFFKNLTSSFQQAMAAQQQSFQQALAQTQGATQQQMANFQLQNMLAQETPEVQRMASQLLADWQRRGLQGFEAKDAIIYARGALGVGKAPAQRGVPASAEDHTIPGGALPPNPVRTNVPAALPDAVLNKMSLAQREAYLAKRLQLQGGIDQPIIFD